MYTVKNVKSFQGMEGDGFECSLYKDGKRVGKVVDTADGGEYNFYLNDGEEDALNEYCASLPKEQFSAKEFFTEVEFKKRYPDGRPVYSDVFISNLVDAFENKARLKKMCRGKTCFRLTTDKDENKYWVMKITYNELTKKHLQDKYGDTLAEIINETIKK